MSLLPERVIFLDRDGVINQDSDAYVKSLAEWIPYPNAIDAMARLYQAGYTLAVATNQSGIARGYYDEETLEAMHQHLHKIVTHAGGKIAHIAYCPHGPDDDCNCRKPLPGLLEGLQKKLGLKTLEGSWMVGDSLRDLQAGEAVGCHSILVRTGKGQKTEAKGIGLEKARVFDDLNAFGNWLIYESPMP
jgi:D-glycero-D-manno-heptose 1,7-bisphosphate phosphatase